jgi:hypothetical protein
VRGATSLKYNGYSYQFIKERGAEILDPSYRRHNFTFLRNLSKRQTEEGTPYT